MHIDRRAFLATLGSATVVEAMSSEARADALEHYMIAQLDKPAAPAAQPLQMRRGTGALFGGPSPSGQRPELTALATMPERPTLTDFIRLRGTPGIGNHILQSANDALKKGESEETVLACLLHDYVLNLMKPDHGWWGAQMMEPYVSQKVSWAIRHHQALCRSPRRRSHDPRPFRIPDRRRFRRRHRAGSRQSTGEDPGHGGADRPHEPDRQGEQRPEHERQARGQFRGRGYREGEPCGRRERKIHRHHDGRRARRSAGRARGAYFP